MTKLTADDKTKLNQLTAELLTCVVFLSCTACKVVECCQYRSTQHRGTRPYQPMTKGSHGQV